MVTGDFYSEFLEVGSLYRANTDTAVYTDTAISANVEDLMMFCLIMDPSKSMMNSRGTDWKFFHVSSSHYSSLSNCNV